MRRPLRFYVVAVGLAGPAAWAAWVAFGGGQSHAAGWALLRHDFPFFLVAGCVLDALTVPMARGGEMSAGLAAFLAALLVMGPLPAALVAAGAALCEGLLHRRQAIRVLFNLGHTTLAILAAGAIYQLAGGTTPLGLRMIGALDVARVAAAAFTIMLVEITAVSIAVSLDRGLPLRLLWAGSARQVMPVDLALAGLGLLVAIIYTNQRQIFGTAGMPLTAVVLLVPSGLLYYASRLKADMLTVYDRTLRTFGALVEVRLQAVGAGARSGGHSARVAALAGQVASKLPLTSEEMQAVRWAAGLHDIGKVAMPMDAWQNVGSGAEGMGEMTGYAQTGYEMLAGVEFLSLVALFIRYHERPYNDLSWRERIGEEEKALIAKAAPAWRKAQGQPLSRWDRPPADLVFLGAQILHAADWYDTAGGDGAPGLRAYMESESGRRFHPDVIEALMQAVRAGEDVHAA